MAQILFCLFAIITYGLSISKSSKGRTEIYDHLKTISSRFGKHFDNIISLRKKLEEAMIVVDKFGTDARSITRSLENIKTLNKLKKLFKKKT